MKKLFLLLLLPFAIVVILTSCKDKNKPSPIKTVSPLEFNNTTAVDMIVDIYDTADYVWKFQTRQPVLSVPVPANSKMQIPTVQLVHGRKYYFDWYSHDSTITSWHAYHDSLIVKNILVQQQPDSFYYLLPFRYDSVSNGSYVLSGTPKKYRNMVGRRNGVNFYAADAYSKTTGQSVWSTLTSTQKQEAFWFLPGFAGYHKSRGWIFYELADTSFVKVSVYDDVVNKQLYGELSDAVPSLGLSTAATDTLYFSPAGSSYIYKMYIK